MRPTRALAALLAALAVLPAAALPAAAQADAELSADARAALEAVAALTADLSTDSTRAEVDAARAGLVELRSAVQARIAVGDFTLLDAAEVSAAIDAALGRVYWYALVVDAREDPEGAYAEAVAKAESAEARLETTTTVRGLRHARDQLRHALGLVTALQIVASGLVDAEALVDLKARIRADLATADDRLGASEACACPLRLEVQTAVRVAVRAVAQILR